MESLVQLSLIGVGIEGLEISKGFTPCLGDGSKCRLQLLENWCSDFCGFLMFAIWRNDFQFIMSSRITMKQVMMIGSTGIDFDDERSMGMDSEDDVIWKESVSDEIISVFYIPFDSLRHTQCNAPGYHSDVTHFGGVTDCLAPFPATTPHAGVFAPFVIISDSEDEITTLPVKPVPLSLDRTPALYGHLLDSGDDASDKDMSETAESLHTQTASTLVVHPPPTRPLPTSPAFARRPGKEISMPLGYRASMDQWRAASPPTYHPLRLSEIPSLSSPPSLLASSSSPPPLLLPSSSRKRSRSPSLSLSSSVSPSPPPTAETINLSARVGSLEQHDVVTRESLRIARGRFTLSQLRAEYAEQEVRELQEFRVTDRLKMAELRNRAQDIEASFLDLESHFGQTDILASFIASFGLYPTKLE
ncbi:hypothetical protein Tco_1501292 [Tanacetum coccineum]